jgi:hypothetical protein
MLIRIGNEYLDFNGDIEIERRSKIFEEIDSTWGDFSYSFEINYTDSNMAKLGIPLPDVSNKTIYKNVFAEVCDNDGSVLYKGQLRVEKISTKSRKITCSFYSGNYNWMALLTGNVNDLDFSEYDNELTETNIVNNMVNTEGICFPVLDTGGIITRSYFNLRVEDFNACMYVKTIFNKIFFTQGIKIQGELLNDFIYNSLIVCKNNKSKDDLEASSCYVEKSSTTTRVVENTDYKLTFQNDSAFPYFDGVNNGFDLANSRYVAPVGMRVKVECSFVPSVVDASYNNRIRLYINGVFTFVDIGLAVGGLYNSATPGDQNVFTLNRTFYLEAGDVLEVYSNWQQSIGSTQNDVLIGSIRITPLFLYEVKGNSTVPAWTKRDFVANILNLFNVVSDYDPVSRTVTFNFFDNIKTKTPVDISPYITIDEVDYSEFISSYGKENIFQYEEGDDEEIRDYNVTKFVKYGNGTINVDNDFINDTETVVSSMFTAPISYINGVFGCSLERVKVFEMEEAEEVDFTAVTDATGNARFAIDKNPFERLELVRISDSTVPDYNGDWVISANDPAFVQVQGLPFFEDATGKIKRLNHKYTGNEDVHIFVNIPFYDVANFSERSGFILVENTYNDLELAYFNILENGTAINTAFKQSISFGGVDSEFSYQKTLLDTYWRNFGNILSDPVKLKATAHFPKSVFLSIGPLTPVYIKSENTTNTYYINRITGYKDSSKPCEVELIKL